MKTPSIEDQLIELYAKVRLENCIYESSEIHFELREAVGKFIDENEFLVKEIIQDFGHRFNVMAPVGGPWHISSDTEVSVYERRGKDFFQLTLQTPHDKYAGLLTFVERTCGIDNLKILINIYFDEYLKIERETHLKFRG